MTTTELFKTAERLEQKIAGASSAQRIELQPQFSAVLERIQAAGDQVPLRLRRLDASLCDEAIEARFDNMPI
ncbi:hypothetical protein LCL97_03820 [Seohaeicola saemankumensis]|nr:hypothetical protein [Seohaeicola saemankumensis]MCA0869941.1 hypothetical protein [Seohaeicola saemankumensis]